MITTTTPTTNITHIGSLIRCQTGTNKIKNRFGSCKILLYLVPMRVRKNMKSDKITEDRGQIAQDSTYCVFT